MTIEIKLDQIIAALATPVAPTVDLTPVLTAVAALATQVTALAAVVGTEAPAPAPESAPVA